MKVLVIFALALPLSACGTANTGSWSPWDKTVISGNSPYARTMPPPR